MRTRALLVLLAFFAGISQANVQNAAPPCAAGQSLSAPGFQCAAGGLVFSGFVSFSTASWTLSNVSTSNGQLRMSFAETGAFAPLTFKITGSLNHVSLTGGGGGSLWDCYSGDFNTPCGNPIAGLGNGAVVTVPANTTFAATFLECEECGTFNTTFTMTFSSGCQANVTAESQGDPAWATHLYDHSSIFTIQNKGCALTCLSMALNNANVSNTPDTLNTLMSHTSGDFDGLEVAWDRTTRHASGGLLQFHATRISSQTDPQTAADYLDSNICAGRPIIVGVDLDSLGQPTHYVLLTGKQGSDYLIADPGSSSTLLSDYDNLFETRGFVSDPAGDTSGLDLAVGESAEVKVTDPSGAQTGFDPGSEQVLQSIPQSAYFRDSLRDDVTGAPPTEISHLAEVFQPAAGHYEITITGLRLGTYSLSVAVFSQDGHQQPELLINGITDVGAVSNIGLELTTSPGPNSNAHRIVSFANAIADVLNAERLGLIDNHGIATSLTQKLQASASRQPTRPSDLQAFVNELSAQTGKHVTSFAAQILIDDATALMDR